jgi:2-polyprenyl-6-methoxyphenol hydroxylase-like FAD-dependent oxidoreductase
MSPHADFDAEVCVIGGGPAGTALACRLATLGHSVLVVERDRFPRPHVGESVSPGVWPLLEMLGARDAVQAAGFPRTVQARVRWGAPATRRLSTAEPGINVDRGVFDLLLLDSAKAAGARILQPAKARAPSRVAGGWEVPLASADGPLTLRARFLADASGRARLLGGPRRRTSPRTVALHALWSGVQSDGAQTQVEAQPESWLWGAHLPGGVCRAMAFLEPELLRRRSRAGERERLYRELLADSSLFAHLLGHDARLDTDVLVCDAGCYEDEHPIDTSSIKVGEAGFAIDPLSSSGVQSAIQTGVAASVAIHSILSPDGDPDAAVAYFREHQRHTVERHRRLTAGSYRACTAHAAEPFWRRRSAGPARPAPSRPVRLTGGAARRTRGLAPRLSTPAETLRCGRARRIPARPLPSFPVATGRLSGRQRARAAARPPQRRSHAARCRGGVGGVDPAQRRLRDRSVACR